MKKRTEHPAMRALMKLAAAFPGAEEAHPWGDTVFKVNKKVFVFMGTHDDGSVGTSTKLPHSGGMALSLPFTEPTGYGLGKSGWVSAKFKPNEKVPYELINEWLKESYLAVAPVKMVKAFLEGAQVGAAAPKKRAKSKVTPKKKK